MIKMTECPVCKKQFIVKDHLKYRLRANSSFIKLAFQNVAFPWNHGLEEIYKAHLVICPDCKREFSTSGYKYFGLLSTKHLRMGLVLFILLFIIASLVVLVQSIIK